MCKKHCTAELFEIRDLLESIQYDLKGALKRLTEFEKKWDIDPES